MMRGEKNVETFYDSLTKEKTRPRRRRRLRRKMSGVLITKTMDKAHELNRLPPINYRPGISCLSLCDIPDKTKHIYTLVSSFFSLVPLTPAISR